MYHCTRRACLSVCLSVSSFLAIYLPCDYVELTHKALNECRNGRGLCGQLVLQAVGRLFLEIIHILLTMPYIGRVSRGYLAENILEHDSFRILLIAAGLVGLQTDKYIHVCKSMGIVVVLRVSPSLKVIEYYKFFENSQGNLPFFFQFQKLCCS